MVRLFVAVCRFLSSHGVWAQQLWWASLVPPTKVQTHAPCIGKWILNHWTLGKWLIILKIRNEASFWTTVFIFLLCIIQCVTKRVVLLLVHLLSKLVYLYLHHHYLSLSNHPLTFELLKTYSLVFLHPLSGHATLILHPAMLKLFHTLQITLFCLGWRQMENNCAQSTKMKSLDNLQIQIDILSWITYRAKFTGQATNLKSKDNK